VRTAGACSGCCASADVHPFSLRRVGSLDWRALAHGLLVGTMNLCESRFPADAGDLSREPERLALAPGSEEALRLLRAHGVRTAIVWITSSFAVEAASSSFRAADVILRET
jgi:hypothetical protein